MPRHTDHRITLRLSPEEYARLQEMAGNRPLSSFVRETALGAQFKRRKINRLPSEAIKLLARVLAVLMQHPLISSFKQVAHSEETSLDPQDDIHATIRDCHALLIEIRTLLMDALRKVS
ncbi:MAG: hypothetical protein ABJO27_15660 [Pseudoruegeria sp.]